AGRPAGWERVRDLQQPRDRSGGPANVEALLGQPPARPTAGSVADAARRPGSSADAARRPGQSVAPSGRGTGCSTSASTRLDMNRAVRTTRPLRVTSATSTTPRLIDVSTRRPARVAVTSYRSGVPPVSTTIST